MKGGPSPTCLMMIYIIISSLSVMLLNCICVDKGELKSSLVSESISEWICGYRSLMGDGKSVWWEVLLMPPVLAARVSDTVKTDWALSGTAKSGSGIFSPWFSSCLTQTGAKDPITRQMMKWFLAHSLIFLFLSVCRARTEVPRH